MSQPGIKLNQFQDIDGHPIKLIRKTNKEDVYEDGNFIVKKKFFNELRSRNAFDFETYKRFQLEYPWCVKVHSYEDDGIVMDKIEGHTWDEFHQYATKDQLWNVCVKFRNETVKNFLDFAGFDYIDPNQHIFFNGDAKHANLIMQGDKPMFIDPDSFRFETWDRFILKVNEHNTEWFNHYLLRAHRKWTN